VLVTRNLRNNTNTNTTNTKKIHVGLKSVSHKKPPTTYVIYKKESDLMYTLQSYKLVT